MDVTRRVFVQSACAAGLATTMGSTFGLQAKPNKEAGRSSSVTGIPAGNIIEEYHRRGLDKLSDSELYRLVAETVAVPSQGFSSFVLHAPLEIMARYGLLPLVRPEHRELARIQMVATAAVFHAGTRPIPDPKPIDAFPDWATATRELQKAVEARDLDAVDAMVPGIAEQFGLAPLADLLTPLTLTTLNAATHAHIGLWQLLRHAVPGSAQQASLLRAATRMIAERPDRVLQSFDKVNLSGERKPLSMNAEELTQKITKDLTSLPSWKGERSGGGIRSLMTDCERTGMPENLFGDVMRHRLSGDQIHAAMKALMRISAHSMLQDRERSAKFGWSHNLTIPQAAAGLAGLGWHGETALAATLVWVTAYRYRDGSKNLDPNWRPEPVKASLHEALHTSAAVAAARVWHTPEEDMAATRSTIASLASIRNDAHLNKYVRACFDTIAFDPTHAKLYLSSAAYLLAHWIQETPEQALRGNLRDGRRTPNPV